MRTKIIFLIQIKNLLEYKQIKENENFSKKVLTNFIIYDIIYINQRKRKGGI